MRAPYAAPVVVQLQARGETLDITGTLVMGVVNASPESYSDGGRYRSPADRIALAGSLVAAGADIIDVGGQSAVTGEPELAAGEEIERVLPIVEWLARTHPDVLISVDTYKPRHIASPLPTAGPNSGSTTWADTTREPAAAAVSSVEPESTTTISSTNPTSTVSR